MSHGGLREGSGEITACTMITYGSLTGAHLNHCRQRPRTDKLCLQDPRTTREGLLDAVQILAQPRLGSRHLSARR